MPVTRAELARRLRSARENCGLTQREVAEELELPRTAVVQVEAGRRAVNSLELERLARLYGRGLPELLAEAPMQEDPVVALLRATSEATEDPELEAHLRRLINLCREVTQLEDVLGRGGVGDVDVSYAPKPPSSRWEAICQGRDLASQERSRLGLAASPLWEIAEILRGEGVRATECPMPDDLSGLFLHGRDIGVVVIVNQKHSRTRRLFSYAHEYCHALADRERAGTISRTANRDELIEVRANAFAAHFLMPEAGVRSFLRSLGKGQASRQFQEVYDGTAEVVAEGASAEPLAAQARTPAGSQEIQVQDVVRLAHYFGASYEAALYHLVNLRLLARDRFDALKQATELRSRIERALRLERWDENAHWSLADIVLGLGLEAHRRGEITRTKLLELAADADVRRADVEAILAAENDGADAVEALIPD